MVASARELVGMHNMKQTDSLVHERGPKATDRACPQRRRQEAMDCGWTSIESPSIASAADMSGQPEAGGSGLQRAPSKVLPVVPPRNYRKKGDESPGGGGGDAGKSAGGGSPSGSARGSLSGPRPSAPSAAVATAAASAAAAGTFSASSSALPVPVLPMGGSVSALASSSSSGSRPPSASRPSLHASASLSALPSLVPASPGASSGSSFATASPADAAPLSAPLPSDPASPSPARPILLRRGSSSQSVLSSSSELADHDLFLRQRSKLLDQVAQASAAASKDIKDLKDAKDKPEATPEERRIKRRLHIANEILSTERKYVDSLGKIITVRTLVNMTNQRCSTRMSWGKQAETEQRVCGLIVAASPGHGHDSGRASLQVYAGRWPLANERGVAYGGRRARAPWLVSPRALLLQREGFASQTPQSWTCRAKRAFFPHCFTGETAIPSGPTEITDTESSASVLDNT
jgi:hypothetical protein